MVSAVTIWTSRVISVIAFFASLYTFWRVVRSELTAVGSFPAQYCTLVFFALAGILSALVVATASVQSPGSSPLTTITVFLIHAITWILTPVYLSVTFFYLKKHGLSITHYFRSELDAVVISALWICLLIGIINRYEKAVFSILLPITVIGICAWNCNIFGVGAMAVLIFRSINVLFQTEEAQNNPVSDKEYLFRDVLLLLSVVILMNMTIWKILAGKTSWWAFFDEAFWEKLAEYTGK
ncbi:unnamed protein product [Allacma fusca]|uniref:Uncharacterized protein n=1 Tax=Allacma fusca TaxID=39272 RepID=A0A8J2PKU9_9HEXA|nr:unnamed protein product [Allacma fusca]